MNTLLTVFSNGIANGAIYALLALALVTVFRTTGHLNFAQGELAALSAFLVLTGVRLGLNIWVAVLVSIALSAVLAALIQRFLMRPLEKRGRDVTLIALLGLFLFVNAFDGTVWGLGNQEALEPFPSGESARILVVDGDTPFYLSYAAIGTFVTLLILLAGWWILLNKTKLGLAYRAVVSNRDSAELVGIPNEKMFALGWALAAVPGALAAVLVTQLTGTLSYTMMINVLVFSFTAACLGGFDSIVGAVVGGLLVGLTESIVPWAIPAVGADSGLVIALVLLLVVLMVRPQGLFGQKLVERV